MFTGIIQKVGTLRSLTPRGGSGRLVVELPEPFDRPLEIGESIAISGVCLTLVEEQGRQLAFDLLNETLARSSLAQKSAGAPVNLERALRAGDAMGGHIVSGHVDCTGVVKNIQRRDTDHILSIGIPMERAGEVLEKGSIALDGVSLTVVAAGADFFSVHVIPHTWSQTAFHVLRAGDRVNIETDLVAKNLRAASAASSAVTMEKLKNAGF